MKKIILILLLGLALVSCEKINVMTYNIHASRGMDKVFDAKRIATVINEQSPDLVALQEVDILTQRSGPTDILAVLMQETGMSGIFMKTFNYQGGEFGNAVLTRYPIIDSKVYRLPSREEYEPRLMMLVRCLSDRGDTIYFYNVHLDHHLKDSDRPQQADMIVESIDYNKNVILAGDFNCEPGSPSLSVIETTLMRSFAKEASYPSDIPSRLIDHIFYSHDNGLRLCNVKVVDEKLASDHRPVVATLRIK